MAFLKARLPLGRPRGGRLKKPEERSTRQVRITLELWNFIEANKWVNETQSDAIFRMIRQANHERNQAQKKVDALEERLQSVFLMKSQYIIREGS